MVTPAWARKVDFQTCGKKLKNAVKIYLWKQNMKDDDVTFRSSRPQNLSRYAKI